MLTLTTITIATAAKDYTPKDGDVIFQTSTSSQSAIIQTVTQSPYSHVGLVTIRDGRPFVFEAINTVQLTPLEDWISRGENQRHTILRPKKSLTPEQLQHMKQAGQSYQGKSYDLPFQWSDERMYCSELVWKIYDAAGIVLIEPRQMKSYPGLTPQASEVMMKRWGSTAFYNELVVAPSDIAESPLLKQVYSSY